MIPLDITIVVEYRRVGKPRHKRNLKDTPRLSLRSFSVLESLRPILTRQTQCDPRPSELCPSLVNGASYLRKLVIGQYNSRFDFQYKTTFRPGIPQHASNT